MDWPPTPVVGQNGIELARVFREPVEADEGSGALLWWVEEQSRQNTVACSEKLLMSTSCRGGPHALHAWCRDTVLKRSCTVLDGLGGCTAVGSGFTLRPSPRQMDGMFESSTQF